MLCTGFYSLVIACVKHSLALVRVLTQIIREYKPARSTFYEVISIYLFLISWYTFPFLYIVSSTVMASFTSLANFMTTTKKQTMNSCSAFRFLIVLTAAVVFLLQARCTEEKTDFNQTNKCLVPKTSYCALTNRSSSHHVSCNITDVCQLESLVVDKTSVTQL